jgi:ubiquinone/menaquinone biosynthesis C-methylase UbiE
VARTRLPEDSDDFARMHPTTIVSQDEIIEILDRTYREGIECRRGMNRRIHPEIARVVELTASSFTIETTDFDPTLRHRIFLSFSLDDRPHFISTVLIERETDSRLVLEIPAVVYQTERRDRGRLSPKEGDSTRIAILAGNRELESAEIVDCSPQGLGLALQARSREKVERDLTLRFLDGTRFGEQLYADVRRSVPIESRPGWIHVGVETSSAPRGEPLKAEIRDRVVSSRLSTRLRQRAKLASAAARIASQRAAGRLLPRPPRAPEIRVVDYANEQGETIRSIVESTGDTRNAPVVILPPAWGKTKETVMPVSATIVATFEAAGEPVSVLRFDGIRKRGESYNDPECRAPGQHHHHYTFSQGARDITTTLDFLDGHPDFGPAKRVLVSFSASAIEARRVVADDSRIDGWVSVVGAADLQSMMRVISGGIDYAVGLEKGVRFGLQQILGVEVDMDRAGLDAFEHSLTYLENSRRDMSRITVPITWIHGRYDAWMDRDRSKDILSRGDTRDRKFIEVPTGHILRSSTEAVETFQLIATEVSRMALGHELPARLPDLAGLDRRRLAERRRLPDEDVDLQSFWSEYLVGKGDDLGIELMMSIEPYQELMRAQVAALGLRPGSVVADLGSGTGALPRFLAKCADRPSKLRVIELDFVRAGLARTRDRLVDDLAGDEMGVDYVEANLDLSKDRPSIGLRSQSVDAVLASLILGYTSKPELLLQEVHRILEPGGRLVLSSLRPDADMSKLYIEGIRELRLGRARDYFGKDKERVIDESAREYLNQASRLLDLEEKGFFKFWRRKELVSLVREAGFRDLTVSLHLGDPAQAIVISGIRS